QVVALLVVVSAIRGQTAPPRASGGCKQGKLDCQQNIAKNERSAKTGDSKEPKRKDTRGIQDNSFLVEEAYNQEFGVVQHISSFTRFWNSKDWVYSFTQEWPVPGDARHQLSYTLLLQHTGALSGSGAGIGDVALNYRYQLVGNSHTRLAFAPRLSVLLPTGDTREGRGSGGVGWQTQLPVSFLVTPKLATHWNAG